jgi:hypothetical protein
VIGKGWLARSENEAAVTNKIPHIRSAVEISHNTAYTCKDHIYTLE